MTHRFPIKEIARQAGLGTATVDRVLNDRAHVSPQTRNRVTAALAELVAQEQQLAARGRRMFVDVVAEAPRRFSRQIRSACEAVLPDLTEAVYRPRFLMQEVMSVHDVTTALDRIRKRGSQGVILKARDVAAVREHVEALHKAGIPVVTLVTDIPGSARIAYAGVDNTRAGRTAAYLLANLLCRPRGIVLASRSQEAFQGEAARAAEFRTRFLAARPGYRIIDVAGGAGQAAATRQRLTETLVDLPGVDAVYSMGGGNRAILDLLAAEDRLPQHFIAHDLDAENLALLAAGRISLVLHHDLRRDLTHALRRFSAWHGLVPAPQTSLLGDLQIITPHNLPDAPTLTAAETPPSAP